jgi:hypothetical protein
MFMWMIASRLNELYWNYHVKVSSWCLYALCKLRREYRWLCLPVPSWTLWTAVYWIKKTTELHGLSPRANYTDRATAACRRSNCQLVRIEGATWPTWRIPPAVFSRFSRQEPLLFYQVAPQLYSRGWVHPVPVPLLFFFLVVPGIEPGPPDL